MRNIYFGVLAWLGLTITACSGVPVNYDFSPEADFASYKTWRWHPNHEIDNEVFLQLGGDIFDARVRNNVTAELAKKGFRLQEQGAVDFYVNYHATTKDKVSVRNYNTYSGYGMGYGRYGRYGPYGGYGGHNQTVVTEYTEGTFLLDIVDPETDTLVWRASTYGKLKQDSSPAKRDQNAAEAVQKLLANFPPPTN